MKKLLIIIICFMLYNAVFSKEKIVIKTSEYPPYVMKDGKGIVLEITKEIYRESRFEIVYLEVPRKRIEVEFIDGKHYYNFATAYSKRIIPKEKIKDVDYRKIIDTRLILYYNKKYNQGFKFDKLEDLKGMKAAVILGTPYRDFYKQIGMDIETAPDPRSNYLKLKSGRVDIVPGFDLTSRLLIKELFVNDTELVELPKELLNDEYGLYFHKANKFYPEVIYEFDKGMKRIKENGKYLEIVEKYYGKGKVPEKILEFIKK